jgi:copper chaperone CopZ
MTNTTTYTVDGMTCGGCAATVTKAVNEVDGVSGAEVDLTTGGVTVTSDSPLDASKIATAVRDAGYQLADA